MSAYVDLMCGTRGLMAANDGELQGLIDRALRDMISDTFNQAKNAEAKRGITIDLQLVRINDDVNVAWKVTPKPAPYERMPEKEKVIKGQTALFPDADSETGEVISGV